MLAASDLCAWPAVNEAYGMALLEAEAAGMLPTYEACAAHYKSLIARAEAEATAAT